MCRRRPGGRGLRRVALCGAQVGDGLCQSDKPEDERDLGERGIAQDGHGGSQ
jgi:hypothetical protein